MHILSPVTDNCPSWKSGTRNESMLPDRVLNPGPPTYESDALLIALCGPASQRRKFLWYHYSSSEWHTPIAIKAEYKKEASDHCSHEHLGTAAVGFRFSLILHNQQHKQNCETVTFGTQKLKNNMVTTQSQHLLLAASVQKLHRLYTFSVWRLQRPVALTTALKMHDFHTISTQLPYDFGPAKL